MCESAKMLCGRSEKCRTPGIGNALGQVEMYVLDTQGQMQPLGVVGELVIGGNRNSPRLSGTGRRYSRTLCTSSHIVRNLGRDCIERGIGCDGERKRMWKLLGRTDHRIKLRGYRIEPGEVEAVLQGYEGIARA